MPEPEPHSTEKPRSSGANTSAQAWGVAMNFVYGVIGLALIGLALQWLWPSTAPWAVLGGLLFGLVGGMVRFIYDAKSIGSGKK